MKCTKCGEVLSERDAKFGTCFRLLDCAGRQIVAVRADRDEARAYVKALLESQERLAGMVKEARAVMKVFDSLSGMASPGRWKQVREHMRSALKEN
jgi:hypothetical protein